MGLFGKSFHGVKKNIINFFNELPKYKLGDPHKLKIFIRDLIIDITEVMNKNVDLDDGQIDFLTGNLSRVKKLQEGLIKEGVITK